MAVCTYVPIGVGPGMPLLSDGLSSAPAADATAGISAFSVTSTQPTQMNVSQCPTQRMLSFRILYSRVRSNLGGERMFFVPRYWLWSLRRASKALLIAD